MCVRVLRPAGAQKMESECSKKVGERIRISTRIVGAHLHIQFFRLLIISKHESHTFGFFISFIIILFIGEQQQHTERPFGRKTCTGRE